MPRAGDVGRARWAALLALVYAAYSLTAWNRALLPDESRPLEVARGPLRAVLELARADLVQTPLSYALQWAWFRFVGHGDAPAKALALLVGVATLALFPFVAARFSPHWRAASLVLLLLYLRVGGPPSLVRMYGLLLLLAVLALGAWESWRRRPNPVRLASWVAVASLLVWTHGSGLLLLAGFAVATWIGGPRAWRSQLAFAVGTAAAAVTLAPWFAHVAPIFAERGLAANLRAIPSTPTEVLARTPFHLLTGVDPGGGSPTTPPERWAIAAPLTWAALVLHLALVAVAWRGALRGSGDGELQRRASGATAAAAALCLAPPLLLFAFSVAVVHGFHPRYLTIVYPAYALLLAGIAAAGGRAGRALLWGAVVPWLLAVSAGSLAGHLLRPTLRQGTELVARERRATDLVVCDRWQPIGYQVVWDWSRRLGRSDPVTVVDSPAAPWLRRHFSGPPLADLPLQTAARVWLFRSRLWPRDRVAAWLRERGFERRRVLVDGWYHLALYERDGVDAGRGERGAP